MFNQILFVLHQIVDKMDNMLQLRTAYGSGPLEELNVRNKVCYSTCVIAHLTLFLGTDLSISTKRCWISHLGFVRRS